MLSKIELAKEEILQAGWIKTIEWFPEIDSTSSHAKRWLETLPTAPSPTVFVADSQTAGRGRSDHQWWSPDGCLMLTVVLGPDWMPADSNLWSQLALVSGLGVCHAANNVIGSEVAADLMVKWPNDLYLSGKKCAGILIESAPKQCWLVGIGLNVHVDFRNAPDDLAKKATSLQDCADRELGTPEVLVELLQNLSLRLSSWRAEPDSWYTEWQERCLLTGKHVRARLPHARELEGTCQGVDMQGRLLLKTACGIQIINAGEILSWY